MRSLLLAAAAVVALTLLTCAVEAKKHKKGIVTFGANGTKNPKKGSTTWTFFSAPLNSLSITTKEAVLFEWKGAIPHAVAMTSDEPTFSSCNTGSGTLTTLVPAASTGKLLWKPTSAGTFYFMCIVPTHCSSHNMKVQVTVS